MGDMSNYLVISALGGDRPGIVNELSRCILDSGCSIADSRMSVLGGEFAVMLLVAGNWSTIGKLEAQLPRLEQQLGMTVTARRTEPQRAGQALLPYEVDVVSMDHQGIVHDLANFFAERNINIQDMTTSSYAAAHTGTPMFSVHMSVGIPADLHIAALREEFLDHCDQLNLDAVIEPSKG